MAATSARRRNRKQTISAAIEAVDLVESIVRYGPYGGKFTQNLIDHHICPVHYRYPDGRVPNFPEDWKDIEKMVGRRRGSLSPSRIVAEFERFQQNDALAMNEDQVKEQVLPLIKGTTSNVRSASGQVLWNKLEALTDGKLTHAKPDWYEGALPEQLHPQVREELSSLIMPSTQENLPILPNFTLEIKGPAGTAAVAERQATYNGALCARGIHSVLSYGSVEAVNSNRTYAVSATYVAGTLKLYSTYVSSVNGALGHYMHQIGAWAMTSDVEVFSKGAAAFRNARDWAKQQRDSAISHANRTIGQAEVGPEASYTSLVLAAAVDRLEGNTDQAYSTTVQDVASQRPLSTVATTSYHPTFDAHIADCDVVSTGNCSDRSTKRKIPQPRTALTKKRKN